MSPGSTFSIGIPTYNHGAYIGAAIDSVLDQTRPPLEIVVCDNFSTDETAAVLARYGDRIRVVHPPEHLPMMANWNHLIGELRGEWVALLSSDDQALPNFVEALERGTIGAPDAVLVRAAVELIDPQGEYVRTRPRPASVTPPPRNFLERLYGPKVNFGAAAWRKDGWERCGGFPESCRLAGDWAFWLALCPHGSFVSIPDAVARYRQGHRSSSEDDARLVLWANDYRAIYREIIPRIARELGGVRPSVIRHAMRVRCHHFLSRLSRRVPANERAGLAEQLEGWARDCGVERELALFREGRTFGKLRFRRLRRWAAGIGVG